MSGTRSTRYRSCSTCTRSCKECRPNSTPHCERRTPSRPSRRSQPLSSRLSSHAPCRPGSRSPLFCRRPANDPTCLPFHPSHSHTPTPVRCWTHHHHQQQQTREGDQEVSTSRTDGGLVGVGSPVCRRLSSSVRSWLRRRRLLFRCLARACSRVPCTRSSRARANPTRPTTHRRRTEHGGMGAGHMVARASASRSSRPHTMRSRSTRRCPRLADIAMRSGALSGCSPLHLRALSPGVSTLRSLASRRLVPPLR